MESSRARSKRQRMSSYYVPLPDLPATFESLNDDSKRLILQFVGNKSYVTYAGISKHCKEVYLTTEGMKKETFVYGYGTLAAIKDRYDNNPCFKARFALSKGVVFYNRRDVLESALEERKKCLLRDICMIATAEGRTDVLDEVWNNLDNEDYKRTIFGYVDTHAARGGRLDVLKWIEAKEIHMNKDWCADGAARHGHLNIIQWLKEEKDLELDGDMYYEAIEGGHLHVMKWLREQKVDWDDDTFPIAAEFGNFDILQWLHDEGCPWPRGDAYCVSEEDIKSETVDWLRANGYGNRLM